MNGWPELRAASPTTAGFVICPTSRWTAPINGSGVGRTLITRLREHIGGQCQLVLLSAPAAMEYYPKIGFQRATHAYFIPRTSA